MSKTPEYTKKAIAAYNAKFERLQLNVPKGTKDRIAKTGQSAAALVNRLLEEYLTEYESESGTGCPF